MSAKIPLKCYKNIQLYEIALSDQNGDAQLHLGEKSGFHSLIQGQKKRDQGAITVKTKTLDNFLQEIGLGNQPIDIIKIDVEGAELRVLRGATKTLSNNEHIILLMDIHPQLGVNPKEVCDFLTERGFSIFHEKPPFSFSVIDYDNLTSIVARK